VLEFWIIDQGRPSPPRKIDQALIRIGRSAANDIVLAAPHVSSQHGQIRQSPGAAPVYEDQRSRNGTFVRRAGALLAVHERPQGRIRLQEGDEVFLGDPEMATSLRARSVQVAADPLAPPSMDTGAVMVLTRLDVTDPRRIQQFSDALDREALLALQRFAARIARTRSRAEILGAFCDAVLGLFDKASHVSVYLHDAEDGSFAPAITRTRHGDAEATRLSRTLRDAVNEQREAVTFTIDDPRFNAAESLKRAAVHAGVCAPLWTGERMAGMAQIDGRGVRQIPFDEHDLQIFAVFSNQLAIAVENSTLHEDLEQTISDLRTAHSRLEHLAFTDALTGLSNRQLLLDRLDQAIKLALRQRQSALLLVADLDGFKRVNDTFGHDAGDELLAIVGERIRDCLRPQDTAARIGGDEFAAIVFAVDEDSGAAAIADKVLGAIREPAFVAGQPITITASIGLAVAPADGDEVAKLLLNAELAMYRAKSLGRDRFHFFTEEMNREAARRMRIEAELRSGLGAGELIGHFQPVVRVSDARVIGLEALVRWQHPRHGLMMPDAFIDVAEQSGLIVPLGELMLRTACREVARLSAAGTGPLRVAVNLSAHEFSEPGLPALVEAVLRETGMDATRLELEITESMLMNDTDQSLACLARLKRLGVSLCVDDFGTGYSSLAYLKRLPVDALKIDRSFTAGVPHDASDVEITAAVIAMAHKLHLRVVAEGVQTDAQLDFLRANGCDEAQGHLFGTAGPLGSLDLARAAGD